MRVGMVGVGRLGAQLVFNLISNPKIDEIQITDIIKEKVEGTILDVSHAYPQFAEKLKATDEIDADIIIITAGFPRTTEKTRLELYDKNKKVMEEILKHLKLTEKTIIVVLTNPVEPLTYFIYKNSGLDWRKVIGFSNILDTARLTYTISKATGVNANKIKTLVIGEHGEKMIPLFSQTVVNGEKFDDFNVNKDEIEKRTKEGSKRILETVGGTQFGPATHLGNLVDSISDDGGKVFPLSFYLEDECYGLKDVCISLPVRVGKEGIKEVVELELNEEETRRLIELAKSLKEIEL
jgi:malate/lactate dehydrogenase